MYNITRKAGIESTAEGYDLIVVYQGEEPDEMKITRRTLRGSVSIPQLYALGVGNCFLKDMGVKQVATFRHYRRILKIKTQTSVRDY